MGFSLGVFGLLLQAAGPPAGVEQPDEIVQRMEEAAAKQRAAMPAYTALRHYTVINTRFKVKASMTVRVEAGPDGQKRFQIVAVSGPGAVRRLVFQRMLDTEAKASAAAVQQETRITPANYAFRLAGTEAAGGRWCYVLEARPKTSHALLFSGRIWVDGASFGIVRIEGAPARSPSFWVRKTHFVHEYAQVEGHWLPRLNRSESELRMFGTSVVTIDYGAYRLAVKDTGTGARGPAPAVHAAPG